MAQDVETVVVTGSRIPQQGLYASSPVTAIGQQELKFEGTTNVGTLLNNLPSVFAGQTNFTGNASTGTATVDLRNLGSVRTLVLIDGKRMAPGDPVVPTADLNQIPAAMIDHVEVLTGGASAVYGSDALAGVVNFIMRKDFEGVEVDGTYSGYSHTNDDSYTRGLAEAAGFATAPSNVFDGQSKDATLLVGVNSANGKGNLTAYFGYRNIQAVLQSERDYSACASSAFRSLPAGSNPRPYDRLRCAGSVNYSFFYGLTGPSAGGGYYFMQPGGNVVPFSGSSDQYFNYGPYNSIQRPDTRYTGGFFGHYEVDKMLDVYANFMFADDHTAWQAAPSALFFGSGPGPSGTLLVSCENPLAAGTDFVADFCPGGVSSPANAEVYIGRRNVEGGARVTDFRHTSYRMVVGAKGDLGGGWAYDMSGQFSTSLFNQLYLHDFSKNRVANALQIDAAGNCISGDPGCIPLDIFHGVGAFTPEQLGYVYTHGQQSGSVEERILNANLTGDLGEYGIQSPWAKSPVALSVGAEYRSEFLERVTSDADQHNDLFGAGGTDTGQPGSGFNVVEGFGEIRVPVAQEMPFFEDLTVTGGFRYSSYSSAGHVNSYKYGAEWQPIEDFRVRGSFQRAVRAPNVLELFSPQLALLGSFEDPCAGAAPTATATQCANTGVTSAQYGHIIQCPASQCKNLLGGNPGLHPEISDTRSFGIVFTPTFFDGFTATIDYFDIRVDQAIANVAPTISISGCLGGNAALCPLIHRDPNGFLFTDTGYVIATQTNTGYLQTKGVDFEANYNADLDDWGMGANGSLSINFIGSWVDEYLVQPFTGASQTRGGKTFTNYDCAGMFGTTCPTVTPEWRHKMRVTWSSPWDVDLSVAWRHMSDVSFDGNAGCTLSNVGTCATTANPFLYSGGSSNAILTAGGHIPDFDYFDFAGAWTVSDHFSLSAGVNNAFDKNPPFLASGGKTAGPTGVLNGNTYPGTWDPLGRYVFVGGTLKL